MTKIPTVLTTQETERVLNAIKYPAGPRSLSAKSFRFYLIVLFMLDAGLRVSEAIQLKRYMIYDRGIVPAALTVDSSIAKLHRSRTIPLSKRLIDEIGYMVEHLWVTTMESATFYVFYSTKETKHITARRVQQVTETAGMGTIGRKVWPHVFRHTFATRLMRVSSARVVQELLGHKNLTSTQIYTHPNSQDLLNAINGMETT